MKIYPIRTLLNLAFSQDILPYPFLGPFAKEYAKAVTEDKDAPLFSRTNKYSSFPVRCQWKESGSSTQQGDSSAFAFSRRNGRREVSKKTRVARLAAEPPLEWRRTGQETETPSMPTTKIQKLEGMHGGITRVLNKITNDNFDAQTSDLLKLLKESEDPETVKILAELILEKVWYDKSFYNLYVSLCQKLWSNTEWNKKAYNVFQMDSPNGAQFFYSTFFQNTNSNSKTAQALCGPFRRSEEAHHEAQAKTHLRSIFLALCRDYFYKREQFIKESQGLPDSTRRYKLRRKLFGTVEILGQFFVMGLLSENIIHYLLLSLIHKGKGARYEEELEAFQLLWNIINHRLSPSSRNEYIVYLEKERVKDWSSRIGFMIQDVLETIPSYKGPKKKPVPKPVPEPVKEPKQEEQTPDVLVEKLVHHSRSTGPLHAKALEALYQKKKAIESTKEYRNLVVKVATALIRDSTEYGEYLNRHIDTLLSMLRSYEQSGLTFSELSESFSEAGEDIAELKLDAPKAPSNMARLLTEVLKGTKAEPFGSEILNISISRVGDEDIDFQEYEECQRKEWESIIQNAGTEIGSTDRVHLFSLNCT